MYTFAHYMLSPPDKVIPYSDNSVVVKVNDPNGTTDLTTPLLSPAHQETVDEDHEVVEATPSRLSKVCVIPVANPFVVSSSSPMHFARWF